jgi:uncharacterized membrane protein
MIFTISDQDNRDQGLLLTMIGIIVAILISYARRRSIDTLASKDATWLFWFIPNFLVALAGLLFSISLLNNSI